MENIQKIKNVLHEHNADIFSSFLFGTTIMPRDKITAEEFMLNELDKDIEITYILAPTDAAMKILEKEYFVENFTEISEFWDMIFDHVIMDINPPYFISILGKKFKDNGRFLENVEIIGYPGTGIENVRGSYIAILLIDGFMVANEVSQNKYDKVFVPFAVDNDF
jgi:hypothetical protein